LPPIEVEMRLMVFIILALAILLSGSSVANAQGTSADKPQVPTVSFCDLARNPSRYDGKTVRVRATLIRNHIGGVDCCDPFLTDLSCYGDDTIMVAKVDPSYRWDAEILRAFDSISSKRDDQGNSRADVTVVGRYDGPTGIGYGNLNWARSQFVIMRYEQVKPVNPRLPWFWQLKKQPAPLTVAEQEIRQKDLRLEFYLVGDRSNKEEIADILAGGYVFSNGENPTGNEAQVTTDVSAAIGGTTAHTIESLRIYGDAAVVLGHINKCSKNVCEEFRYTNVYVTRDRSWRAVVSHLVRIK
jgi:hypothetical protein